MYCLVEKNTIVSGPSDLPFAFKNMIAFDKVDDPVAYGWYPFEESEAPTFNPKTQKLVETASVVKKTVKQVFTVLDLNEDELLSLVPSMVSSAQAKVALYNAGLLAKVEDAIAAENYKPIQIYWANASYFERGHPYIQGIGAAVGLSEKQINDLFTAAVLL